MKILSYEFGVMIEDVDRNIYIEFGSLDGCKIERVAPFWARKSPVPPFLSKVGVTPYHICYINNSTIEDVERLKKRGFKIIISLALL